MKNKNHRFPALSLAVVAMLAILNAPPSTAVAQGTAFTYQGRLNAGGNPASGTYNLTFSLFTTNTSGVAIAGPVTNSAVLVTNGLFTVLVDFGAGAFTGTSNWLEIAVRTNGATAFATLAPRQPITPTPYAFYAGNAGTAGGLSGTLPVSQVSGVVPLAQLPVAVVTNGQVGNVTLNGSLVLPATATSADTIYSGSSTLLRADNNYNFFAGVGAGNLTTSGSYNTASGLNALSANTGGSYNTASGSAALASNTGGSDNTADGVNALFTNLTGHDNTASGLDALSANTVGNFNTAAGIDALMENTSGSANTASGTEALYSNTNGSYNTAFGADALFSNTSGSDNIALGYHAGYAVTGSYNIDIGNLGLSSDNNLIRIGSGQTQTFIAGVINGNGGGLTNLNAAGLTGTVPAADFSGLYNNALTLNNAGNNFSGTLNGNAATATTANSFSGSLAGDVTGPQSATVVSSVGGLVATNIASGANAANAATSAAAANTIMKRDPSGNVADNSLTLYGNLSLPATTASAGIINLGGSPFLHAYGSQDIFAGSGAGNVTMSGYANTAVGYQSLHNNTSGSANTANGEYALFDNTTGFYNTANGVGALNYNTSGSENTANGGLALYSNTTGSWNTANGFSALNYNTSGSYNTANGANALQDNTGGSYNTANGVAALYSNTSGSENTANGDWALYSNTNGFYNTANGVNALFNETSGSQNIAMGFNAGFNITTGSYNIDIGNQGVASDNNIIRIGSGQSSAFINAASLTVSGTLSATDTIYADSAAQNTGALNPGLIFGGTGSSEGIASKRTSGTDQYGIDFYTQGIIRMTLANNGNVGIGTTTPGYLLVVGNSGSPAYCNGTTWQNGSDRNSKEAFTAINPRAVLEKVSALPITEWKYKVEADGTEHIGPMAQDFHAAFGLNGKDDKHISTVDESGVALAAIQGLNEKLEAEAKTKDAQIQALQQSVAELKALVEKLAGK